MPNLNTPDKITAFGVLLTGFHPGFEVKSAHIPPIGADLGQDPYKITLSTRDGSLLTLTITDTDLMIPEVEGAD